MRDTLDASQQQYHAQLSSLQRQQQETEDREVHWALGRRATRDCTCLGSWGRWRGVVEGRQSVAARGSYCCSFSKYARVCPEGTRILQQTLGHGACPAPQVPVLEAGRSAPKVWLIPPGWCALQAQLATLASLGIAPPHPSSAADTPTAHSTSTLADLSSAAQQAGVHFVARVAATLAQWLPPFWVLTQVG